MDMMTQIKAFVAANKIAFYAGLALLLGVILLLAYCQGRDDGKQGEEIKRLEREASTQKNINAADNKAADARVLDATRSAQQRKELHDALEAIADPDSKRALRGCVILRQQGRDTSRIPACGRFAD